MKLLPVVVVIVLIFILGLVFLHGRTSRKSYGFGMYLPLIVFALLAGIFFLVIGRPVLFFVMLGLAVILLTYKRSY